MSLSTPSAARLPEAGSPVARLWRGQPGQPPRTVIGRRGQPTVPTQQPPGSGCAGARQANRREVRRWVRLGSFRFASGRLGSLVFAYSGGISESCPDGSPRPKELDYQTNPNLPSGQHRSRSVKPSQTSFASTPPPPPARGRTLSTGFSRVARCQPAGAQEE